MRKSELDSFEMRVICLLVLLGSAYCYGNSHACNGMRNPYVTGAGPFVRTSSGILFGKYENVSEKEVSAFLGVPYAYPPVSERRFLKPEALDHWEGLFNATAKPRPCMQYSSRNFSWIPTSTPSEDCLYLNVWTPFTCFENITERLPVLVWIYGGGFYSGSTDMDVYDGSIIASQNKSIIASINYRVGIFGFLNVGTEEAPGNVGLLDQNVALKWIKKNIRYFGGDPNKITIMGESAGAWSVSLHMLSPLSCDLFNAAILQSGASYHPQLVDSRDLAYYKANTYAKVIGCVTGNSSIETDPAIMECIKAKSSLELAKAEDIFTSKLPMFFLPTHGDDFLPLSPATAIRRGLIAPVNILIGSNLNEATIFLNYMMPEIFKQESEPLLNLEAAQQIMAGLFNSVPNPSVNVIYEQYFRNVSGSNPSEIVGRIGDAFGDYILHCPVYFFAEKAKNAYVYWFTHRSANEQMAEWLGVPHFYEVPYVFGLPLQGTATYSPDDRKISTDLIKKWTTFARTGHPLEEKNLDQWPLFTTENHMAYELNPDHEGILPYPRESNCEFWRPYISPDTR